MTYANLPIFFLCDLYDLMTSVTVVSPDGLVTVEPEEQTQPRLSNVTFTCSTLAGPDNMFMWFYRANTESCTVCQSGEAMFNLTGMWQP